MVIKIFDFLASVFITLGIFSVASGSREWWLVYFVGSVLFIVVQANSESKP